MHIPSFVLMRAPDIATLLRKGIGVGEAVLPAVTFTPNGMTISWKTTGPVPQELSYTVGAAERGRREERRSRWEERGAGAAGGGRWRRVA